MKRLLLIIYLLGAAVVPGSVAAQEAGSIAGRVVDAETQAPLSDVTVYIQGQDLGTLTRADGSYLISNVPPGSYVVVFHILGYGTATRPDVIVAPGRSTPIDAQLQVAVVELEGIVVDAGFFQDPPGEPASTFELNAEEIRREPGSAGDISRVLLALPSTAQISDQGNDLFVRGGAPFENGFFIDGIQVGNINHFPVQGSTGGPIGMVNLEWVDDVQFSAGGFSAAYGDRLSSIVDIHFRDGSPEKTEVGAEVSMMDVEGSAEGPLGDRGSWLFSARKSYMDLIVDAVGTGVAPGFEDAQGKVSLDLNPSNRISALALMGRSRIDFTRDEAEDDGNVVFGDYNSRQGTIGTSWRRLWGSRGYSLFSLSASEESAQDDWFRTSSADSAAQSDYTERAFRFRNLNRIRLGSGVSLELGADAEVNRNRYDYVLGAHHDRLGNPVPRFQVNRDHNEERAGAFGSVSWTLTPAWDLTAGGRVDHYTASGDTRFSPRVSSSLAVTERVTLNAAAGLFTQRLPGFILSQDPSYLELPLPEAVHLVLGADYLVNPSTQLSLEGYWKEYRNMPMEEDDPSKSVLDDGTSSGRFWEYSSLVGTGKARAYGVELLLQKKLTHRFYGLASASLFRSKYRGLDDVWRSRAHDHRFLFNAVAGYRPSHYWEFSARWSIAGGAPYTPFDAEASEAIREGVVDAGRTNAERYPTYHSLNLKMARRFVFRGSALTSYIALWNAYGQDNVAEYYWNEVDNAQDTRYQWGFLPVFGLEWKF